MEINANLKETEIRYLMGKHTEKGQQWKRRVICLIFKALLGLVKNLLVFNQRCTKSSP